MILGNGMGPGLVIVRRSLLRQICAQMDSSVIASSGEHLGFLLGPEPQGNELHVADAIPLGNPYCLARSPEMLLAGIKSVRPFLEEARRERSHTIVGFYRILRSTEHSLPESGFEFVSAKGQMHSPRSSVRCRFVFICTPASETLLRVYMRNGKHWQQIQELTLQWEPSPDLTPQHAANVNVTERPHAGQNANLTAKNIRGRLWFEVAIVMLLLLSLALNTVMVRFDRRIQQEKVKPEPITDQIRGSAALVPQLPPPPVPEASPSNQQLAKAHLPPKRVSNPPPIGTLAITKKPARLKPSEAFQFEVKGNPAPEVAWSSEGPGSIDPVYGLYRAPRQFAGETKVKIIAKSWSGSQSVTFTLKGGPQ